MGYAPVGAPVVGARVGVREGARVGDKVGRRVGEAVGTIFASDSCWVTELTQYSGSEPGQYRKLVTASMPNVLVVVDG